MKTNFKNYFAASMDLDCNLELNNEENLKHINTCFIKGFIEQEKLLTNINTQADLEKTTAVRLGFAVASGNDRAARAIVMSLSTLLCNDKLSAINATLFLHIASHTNEISIDEIGLINEYVQEKSTYNTNIVMTVSEDENLGESLAITVILC